MVASCSFEFAVFGCVVHPELIGSCQAQHGARRVEVRERVRAAEVGAAADGDADAPEQLVDDWFLSSERALLAVAGGVVPG